jgi:RNA polymerase sigma-70 factor (ECF subfamily)
VQVDTDGRNGTNIHEEMLRCVDALYGYAMTLTHDPTEAEDLVQDTYMQGTLHCERLRPDSNVKAWMFTIMRNRWLKQLRHAACGPEFVALDDVVMERWMADSDQEPGHLCERIWEREEIRAALKQLPVGQREIILLRDIEGFSYKEMAEMVNCPVGTIMSRLSRARAKFKVLLVNRQHDHQSPAFLSRN